MLASHRPIQLRISQFHLVLFLNTKILDQFPGEEIKKKTTTTGKYILLTLLVLYI